MDIIDKIILLLSKVDKDKYMHVCVAGAITAVLHIIMPFWWCFVVMSALFLYKETRDKETGKGTPEWGDIVADYIGFIIGIL